MLRTHPLSPLLPRSLLRLPRRTARLRLTLLYGGLFLACGAALLAITYALVRASVPATRRSRYADVSSTA